MPKLTESITHLAPRITSDHHEIISILIYSWLYAITKEFMRNSYNLVAEFLCFIHAFLVIACDIDFHQEYMSTDIIFSG